MQRVHVALVDGRARSDERLPQHLAAEHLRAADVTTLAAEQVDLDALELEKPQKIGKQGVHRRVTGRLRAASA